MKKCEKCGASNQENARFCRECGNNLLIQAQNEDNKKADESVTQPEQLTSVLPEHASVTNANEEKKESHKEPSERNDAICPFCHEPGCHPLEKSITESKTIGYKWGTGCCGMFLMGPFGLLCGLCGTGSKTKTTSEMWWACTKCGKEHIALTAALNKWETFVSSLPLVGLSTGFVALIAKGFLRWFMEWLLGTGFIWGFVTSVVTFIVPLLIALVSSYATVTEWESNISEAFGESFAPYLTEEQAEKEKNMTIMATAIAVAITVLGLSLLRIVLG